MDGQDEADGRFVMDAEYYKKTTRNEPRWTSFSFILSMQFDW